MTTEYRVRWTHTARADLEEIVDFIAADNAANALSVLDRLHSAVRRLEHMPERGRYVPELKAFDIYKYRELVVAPWRIIYRHERNTVLVLGVLDSRRNLEGLLLERLVRG